MELHESFRVNQFQFISTGEEIEPKSDLVEGLVSSSLDCIPV